MSATGNTPAAPVVRPRIAFVDYGGTPYAAICTHLARPRAHQFDIAPPLVVGRSAQSLWQRLKTTLRLWRHGLPPRRQRRQRMQGAAPRTLPDILIAIDERTVKAVRQLGWHDHAIIHPLTSWSTYRRPMHSAELREDLFNDLEAAVHSVLDKISALHSQNSGHDAYAASDLLRVPKPFTAD